MSPADVASLISGTGAVISGFVGWGAASFKIGRWEGSQQAKLDRVIQDVGKLDASVTEIKKWDFARLSADVSEIKGMFVLRLRE